MKGGAWLVLAVSMLMGLGLTIGAIASRRQMRTAVVVVLCLVGIGIVLAGAALSIGIGILRARETKPKTPQTNRSAVFFVSGAYSLPGCGFATRKIMRGVSVLAFVFGAMDSVMNELPPMTEFAPMTVLPPRMDAPE